MAKHPDAVGYLDDLAEKIAYAWFKKVRDLVVEGKQKLDPESQKLMLELMTGAKAYVPAKRGGAKAASAAASAADFLESIHNFSQFKRLGDNLKCSFDKRVTVVFGANGSGKSSFCESIQVLSSATPPARPLENVHLPTSKPSFAYKFRSDSSPQPWNKAVGFGRRGATVKYFDTRTAVNNVHDSVDVGRIIELAPFRLSVFENARDLTNELRSVLEQFSNRQKTELGQALTNIRNIFSAQEANALSTVYETNIISLDDGIKAASTVDDAHRELLRKKRDSVAVLTRAATDEGIKIIRAEARATAEFVTQVSDFVGYVEKLWAMDPAKKSASLVRKRDAQAELLQGLFPTDATADDFLALLTAANTLHPFGEHAGDPCPLCKRALGKPEQQLFVRYHQVLAGELERACNKLEADILNAKGLLGSVQQLNYATWRKNDFLPKEILAKAIPACEIIVCACDETKSPSAEAAVALQTLKKALSDARETADLRTMSLTAADGGRAELTAKLNLEKNEARLLEYAALAADHIELLKAAKAHNGRVDALAGVLKTFPPVLREITKALKEAYESLVVPDFEARLDGEYKKLAERPMSEFGVVLMRQGRDTAVSLHPQVGGKEIAVVLSEGEQRLHALALFFAELDSCPQSVIVFDDPVSSFDCDFISNYCRRLRDFVASKTDKQVIVLTHNWEFFCQIQLILREVLSGQLSVQVIENCAIMAEYEDRLHELKQGITATLKKPGELTGEERELLSGRMRRLIEAVVNEHVFNNQRFQFIQRAHKVSEFAKYTGVRPLLDAEAQELRDLFRSLSTTEHDDPRQTYQTWKKSVFQTRFNNITAIENAIIGRK